MRRAAVAIVGGGVVGASIAYHLASAGVRDIVVLDRGSAAGAGSTARATGGFRAQFHTAVNVRLSLLSRAKLLSFLSDTGVDPGYEQTGYLWLASSAAELAGLRAGLELQDAEGLTEARELAIGEITAINDAVSLEGVLGATFCPSDGYIRPMEILRGYLSACARLGVTVQWDTNVTAMEREADGLVRRIHTNRDTIETETVVNAAGAWSAAAAALAGFHLPVVPLRRQVAVSAAGARLSARMPMTIYTCDGFHVRVRDGRAVLCWPTPGNAADPFDTSVDRQWHDDVTARARKRIPALAQTDFPISDAYAGLYEMSPDSHAILGFAAECPNMFLANGSSGHGVMHAPALGQLAAEMIRGRTPAVDVTALRPSRFAEGAANPPSWIL